MTEARGLSDDAVVSKQWHPAQALHRLQAFALRDLDARTG
jgi:hypothetical protein